MTVWQIISTALSLTAIGSTAIAWTAKKIFTHFLDRDIEAYKSKLEFIEFRSTKLHEKRGLVIENIYQKLIKAHKLADKYISNAGRVSQDELRPLGVEATSARLDYFDYFDDNQIYFDENLCKKLADYDSSLGAAIARVESQSTFTDATAHQMLTAKDDSLKKLMTESLPIQDELAKQFREILGVIEKP